MASALASHVKSAMGDGMGAFIVTFDAFFTGSDVPNNFTQTECQFVLTPGDSASTIQTNMTTQVVNGASALGLTVARTSVTIPQFQIGA